MMTVVTMTETPQRPTEAGGRKAGRTTRERRLTWRRSWMVAFLCIAMALVLVPGTRDVRSWFRYKPLQSFDSNRFLAGFEGVIPSGTQFHVAIQWDLSSVTVRSARPIFANGSVPAAEAVTACRPKGGPDALGPRQPGPLQGDLTDYCSQINRVDGLDLGSLARGDILVLSVTTLSTGPVEINGVDLTYEQGRRRGSQRVGPTVEIRPRD